MRNTVKYSIWVLLVVVPFVAYGNEPDVLFEKVRAKHTGMLMPSAFGAEMSSASAKKLIQNKIPAPYTVKVDYHTEKGVDLLVCGSETFYQNFLSSYAVYINTMMLPLLSTAGYTRLRKRFTISIPKENVFRVEYRKGDIPVTYFFKIGMLGLVSEIAYFEKNKKIFVLSITWEKLGKYFVPHVFKTISYDKTRTEASFEIRNISILSNR
ncbi:MAG: hypothetical protein ACRCTQ_01045 [Brevinemataceae bacterium]